MLQVKRLQFHVVKEGQTLGKIAEAYSVSPRLLARENGLQEPPFTGQILRIPNERGNAYTVREGDTKELLCGSADNFSRKNGGGAFYIGMLVIL
ncbi:MAG: LysM peptidoglycan-binding domain-containing protein [Clostridia bacterium]|nr:LysM peptidoglycan-binding domain-containing protein [Clostridia bacterium]